MKQRRSDQIHRGHLIGAVLVLFNTNLVPFRLTAIWVYCNHPRIAFIIQPIGITWASDTASIVKTSIIVCDICFWVEVVCVQIHAPCNSFNTSSAISVSVFVIVQSVWIRASVNEWNATTVVGVCILIIVVLRRVGASKNYRLTFS